MKVGVLCEESGVVRDAFAARGHDAWSCDILPRPGKHIRGDCLAQDWTGFDLLICHPTCTYTAFSGAKHLSPNGVLNPKRWDKMRDAAFFIMQCLDLAGKFGCRVCVEQPLLHPWVEVRIGKPDQKIQPWMFGDAAQKTTCLRLRGLPHLIPTNVVDPGEVHITSGGKKIPKWYSQAPKRGGLAMRRRARSRTFPGIAAAMADQWGVLACVREGV